MSASQPKATPTQEQIQGVVPWPSSPFCSLNPATSPRCPQWPLGCSTPCLLPSAPTLPRVLSPSDLVGRHLSGDPHPFPLPMAPSTEPTPCSQEDSGPLQSRHPGKTGLASDRTEQGGAQAPLQTVTHLPPLPQSCLDSSQGSCSQTSSFWGPLQPPAWEGRRQVVRLPGGGPGSGNPSPSPPSSPGL